MGDACWYYTEATHRRVTDPERLAEIERKKVHPSMACNAVSDYPRGMRLVFDNRTAEYWTRQDDGSLRLTAYEEPRR